jgi:hypothetical protein
MILQRKKPSCLEGLRLPIASYIAMFVLNDWSSGNPGGGQKTCATFGVTSVAKWRRNLKHDGCNAALRGA